MVHIEHINRVELQGHVGNVRIKELNGTKVCNFTLATELLYKSREGVAIAETTWHNVVAWESSSQTADLSQIAKGSAVHVTGRIRMNSYKSAEGEEKQYYEILANSIQIMQ